LCVLAVWLMGVALAGADSLVSGHVTDPHGRPIAGATIVIRLSSGLERVALSGADGRYTLSAPFNGPFTIIASASGFSRKEEPRTPDAIGAVDFTLDPMPVVEHVTVVSGTRQDELRETLNTRVDVVSRERMRDSGADTVGDVLQEMPGVVTRRGSEGAGAAGEQIQGIDSRQSLVLLDGQPILGARGIKRGAIDLDRQSVGRLERVEVVKGAASALYGSDAIGGVINLITRDSVAPLEFSGEVTGGNRGYSTTRGDAGWRRERWTGLFSLERHSVDSFDLTPSTPDTTGAELRRFDEMAKVRGQLTDNFAISALGSAYQNNAKGSSVGELGPQHDRTRDKGQYINLAADWQAAPRVSLTARGYLARYDEDANATLTTGVPIDPANLDERFGKVDATARVILDDRQFLQGGVEWQQDRYRGTNRLRDDGGDEAETAVAWLQHRIGLWNRATITSGVRYDHHSIFGNAVSPKLAVNARVTDDVRLRASYGRGFRAPDLGQLYYRFLNPTNFYQVIGNPSLQPEHANSFQFGGEYIAPDRRVRFGLNGFRNDVRDLIESVSLGFVATQAQLDALMQQEGIEPGFRPVLNRLLFLYKNVSDIKTQGVEADGEVAVTRSLSVAGAYTYLDAKDKTTGLALTGRNPHQGHVRATWRSDALGLRANIRGVFYSSWINSRSTTNGTTTEIVAPKFALWDLFVAKRLGRAGGPLGGLEALVAVENLADSRDPNSGVLLANGSAAPIYRPEYGRTVRFGLRFDWSRGARPRP
jgi:outer membrane receptor for ferrienterochelin and colicins